MEEVETFLAAVMPRLTEADRALHNGDAGPRIALWSRTDPVTLFGAAVSKSGQSEMAPLFEWLASRFSDCEEYEYEVMAAGTSGDLAYVAGIEHTTASVDGAAPMSYALRVTTLFRREDGEWKIIHRHADPAPESGSASVLHDRLLDDSGPAGKAG